MLEIKSVSAKNFLSYGNKWNEIDLKKGINLVIGYDKQKQRSNGAGKTSFMEIISFALFGSVSKGLKKSQIINWKNKKNCEVKIVFDKNGVEYKFHRGIKPNFIKVYKDGNDYPINSSVKEFQSDIEDQLIGMDFKIFNSLIYSNPNNSISLLDTPKAQKRAFIEKQFNLTEFSLLNKLNNEHLKNLNLEIYDSEKIIEKNKDYINDLILEKESIKDEMNNINLDKFNIQINEYKNKLLKFKDISEKVILNKKKSLFDIKKLQQDKQDTFNKLNEKKSVLKEKLIETTTIIKSLKKQKDSIGDLTEKMKDLDLLKKESNKIKIKISKYDDVEELLEKRKEGIPELKEQLDNLNKCYKEHNDIIKEHAISIKSFNIDNLKGKSKCPTCHQNVDFKSIKNHIQKEIDVHQNYINQETDSKNIISKGIEKLNDRLKKRQEDIDTFTKKINKKNQLERDHLKLDNKIAKLESYSDKQIELDGINKEIKKLLTYTNEVKIIEQLDKDLNLLKDTINDYNDEIKKIEIEINDDIEQFDNKKDTTNKLDLLKKELLHNKEIIKKCDERITIKSKKIVKMKDENSILKNEISMKIKEVDHLKYIREMLKDENIKQFAISHMIPIIERQANYYLGEAGFGFFLKLDNWIDAEIKGPGITDCSFASMSGGERKSIDLALKFAIMDISIARIPDFPDILILDELLDSSVDAYGIQQLIEIIKVKQVKNNLKLFLISHRTEIDNFEPDNVYKITKNNGYSTIEMES